MPRAPAYTEAQRRNWVLAMMRAGADEAMIVEQAELPKNDAPSFPAEVAKRYVVQIRAELKRDFDASVSTYRAEQLARLHRDIVELRLEGASGAGKKKWSAIRQHEQLIADITGTRRVKVDVGLEGNLSMGLAAVVGALTPDEYDELVEEQREVERLAGERRSELKILPGGKRAG